MLKICVLDAAMLGEDMDLSCFEKYGTLTVYKTTEQNEILERINNKDVIITNKVVLDKVLEKAEGVKLICVTATGTNNINIKLAKKKNVAVTNVAGYSTASVAQHTFALLLNVLESIKYYDDYVKSKEYTKSGAATHFGRLYWELEGKTWGIIGMGAIGKKVASIASAFGCKIVYYSTSGNNNSVDYHRLNLEDVLKNSDVVSIHAPLNDNTKNLIEYNQLKLMKRNAILINVGRGGIVNEKGLQKALDENLIWGAGLDVLECEPIKEDNPLLDIKNEDKLLITPHIAWASIEARTRLLGEVMSNIEAFFEGRERNRIC